ncbi:hypothetical protein [Flavobacterium sp.]|uniref:hypothetical protein n=1 Tax=Flavobacterium sp. TaxID=239 RepID=UPI0037BFF741
MIKLLAVASTVLTDVESLVFIDDDKNKCDQCQHSRYPSGGHCYMFKEEPKGCRAFKADARLNEKQ